MTQHTPGPWTYHEDGDANHYCILAESRWLFGLLHNGEQLTEKQRANLRLVAAAPDLFEALRDLIGCADSHRDRKEILVARAAIAKAVQS